MSLQPQNVYICASKAKASALAILGAAVAALSSMDALGVFGEPPIIERSAAILTCVLMLGLVVSRALFLLVTSTPLLIITSAGITIEPALFGDQVIPWSNIRDVRYRQVRYGFGPLPLAPRRWLSFTIGDTQRFRSRLNIVQRVLAYMWYAEVMFRGGVGINSGLPSMPIAQIYQELLAHSDHRVTR